jgi:hypothetical protein
MRLPQRAEQALGHLLRLMENPTAKPRDRLKAAQIDGGDPPPPKPVMQAYRSQGELVPEIADIPGGTGKPNKCRAAGRAASAMAA